MNLPCGTFEIAPGIVLSPTYVAITAPLILAFSPPIVDHAPHPGPWAALSASGLLVTTQIELTREARPLGGFDRLNDIWFLVAMIRLRTGQAIQMPFVSDRPLADIAADTESANTLAVEVDLSRPLTARTTTITLEDLEWVRDNIIYAADLMRTPIFNRAFQTLDRAHAINSRGAGIVIAWAAIETLLRPGEKQITKRLCRSLACLIAGAGPTRDRTYNEIATSYKARGGAAHAGAIPEQAQFQTAFQLARQAVCKVIETKALPDIEELLARWTLKQTPDVASDPQR